MNALDFLIDFTTLLSTSVEPVSYQDEDINAYIDPIHDPGPPSLNSVHPLPFEQYNSTQQAPKENITRKFATDPPSRQMLPSSFSHLSDCKMIANKCQSVPLSSFQHSNHTSQVSTGYLQEDPCLGIPSNTISVPPQVWHQQPEDLLQWSTYDGAGRTMSSVPVVCYGPQIPCAFEPAQYQPARCGPIPEEALHFQAPCNNSVSQGWAQSPQAYHPAEDTWLTSSADEPPFDCDFPPKYNEWTLKNTTSTNLNTV